MRTINMDQHSAWGDSIYFLDYKERRMTGHMTPKPEIGDRIKVEMKSKVQGRSFRFFTVISLEDFRDPPDQFVADVRDSGYSIGVGDETVEFHFGEKCPFCKKVFKKDFSSMLEHMEKKHLKEMGG